jgi:hypothetical protein
MPNRESHQSLQEGTCAEPPITPPPPVRRAIGVSFLFASPLFADLHHLRLSPEYRPSGILECANKMRLLALALLFRVLSFKPFHQY